MGEDAQFLAALIGFPVLCFTLAMGFVLLQRRLSTVDCPSCGRRIAGNAVTEEAVYCHDCWTPTPERTALTEGFCHHCGRALESRAATRLWDGHDYCDSCMAEACPDLRRLAQQRERLEETLPHSAWRVARNVFLLGEGAVTASFGTLFFAIGVDKFGGIGGGLLGLLFSQMIGFPLIVVFAVAAGIALSMGRTTVCVVRGALHVWSGRGSFARFDLSECEWFVGPMSHVSPFLGGEALVIALPRGKREQEKFVAAGFREDTRELWKAMLTLANVPRRTAWEQRLGGLRKALNWAVVILGLPVCFGGGFLLARLLGHAVLKLTGDAALAGILAMLALIGGGVYGFIYLMVLWPWHGVARGPSRRTLEEQASIKRRIVLGLTVTNAVMFAVPVLFWQGAAFHTRIIGALAFVLLAWLVGADLGRRAATLDWATTEKKRERNEADG